MGTTRIKVIDLSSEVEQIKTSRKRAQTGAIAEIKKSLIGKKPKEKPKATPAVEVGKPAIEKESLGVQPLKREGKESLGVQPLKREGKAETKKTLKTKVSKEKFKKVRSKKYQNVKLLIDKTRFYQLDTALELVKKVNLTSFDGSIEAHIVVKQKGLRGFVVFPHPVKKETKILVFATSKDGLSENGVILGNEQTILEIEGKKLLPKKDFSLVISTPEFMPKLAVLGKILGPSGLMPNPKTGTLTEKPAEVVKKFSQGTVEFKTQNDSFVIHQVIGKISQDASQLKANFLALVKAIGLNQIEKVYLTPTMGPSIRVSLSSIAS